MVAGRIHARRKMIVVATIAVLMVFGGVLAVLAAAPPNIDDFSTTQTTLNATPGTPASGTATEASGAGVILGREREAYARVVSGPNNLGVIFNGTTMSISTGDATVGETTLTYDGTNNNNPLPSSVDPIGLCTSAGVGCPDLTQSGTTNGFRIVVPSDDTLGDLKVKVWWGGDNTGNSWCEVTLLNFFGGGFPLGPGRTFFVEYPFVRAGICSGTTTNLFQQAGAVQFQITGAALDMTIDTIDISVFDWGDLPETVGSGLCASSAYATTMACEGPRHVVTPGLILGSTIDPSVAPATPGELNGQPTVSAKGDDMNGIDDEDGVVPVVAPPWANGGLGTVSVTVQGTGYLVGWIDLNGNGFQASEAFINTPVTTGTANYSFIIPAGTIPPTGFVTLYARFRLFPPNEITSALAPYAFDGRDQYNQFLPLGLTPPGQSKGGEVEDHVYYVSQGNLAVTLASFVAEAQADGVGLSWETTSEIGNAGFNLYRAASTSGPQTRLNADLIPSQAPGSTQGALYEYLDSSVVAGQSYWYWLESVDVSGATVLHGPVSVALSAPTAVTLTGMQAGSSSASPFPWLMLVAALAGLGLVADRLRQRSA